ncbi:unnamed protein product [Linum tenue]|uniref:Avr9/Cf-9 rapidly elicited protein 146 n=1 Tax=Linum tenue TaxID=586396 RepID=A0AAV0KTT9_9ROSI|nr:unnamed protein product [Linum tenue]
MLRRGISKSRVAVDLGGLIAKRGNKLAGKAIGNFLTFNGVGAGCRSNDADSLREYEFSCSNSPAAAISFFPFTKRGKTTTKYDEVAVVQRMVEMLNFNEEMVASPMTAGFGRSPTMMRQLRITDSPFPVREDGGGQVDKAADEFIKRFYKDLKSEKATSFESPYHSLW